MPAIMTPGRTIIAGLVISTCILAACGSPISSTTSRSAPTTAEPTVHFSNATGDTASVTLHSQPLVQPGQVPNDIAQACLADDNAAHGALNLNETLFREVDGALTITSKRAIEAGIQFGLSRPGNSPREQTVVEVTSTGPVCSASTALTWNIVPPGQAVHFAIWLIYPNVLTPSHPNGDQAAIDGAAWSTPTVFLTHSKATIRFVTGAGLTDALFFPAGQVVNTTHQ
jgi:hypothetical protein